MYRIVHTAAMAPENVVPWGCQVCGHTEHTFRHHLDEVIVPEFVHTSVGRLRELERTGLEIHPLVEDVSHLAEHEEGGRKAWALWLHTILAELEDASDAPDVAVEIENFLLGGYST